MHGAVGASRILNMLSRAVSRKQTDIYVSSVFTLTTWTWSPFSARTVRPGRNVSWGSLAQATRMSRNPIQNTISGTRGRQRNRIWLWKHRLNNRVEMDGDFIRNSLYSPHVPELDKDFSQEHKFECPKRKKPYPLDLIRIYLMGSSKKKSNIRRKYIWFFGLLWKRTDTGKSKPIIPASGHVGAGRGSRTRTSVEPWPLRRPSARLVTSNTDHRESGIFSKGGRAHLWMGKRILILPGITTPESRVYAEALRDVYVPVSLPEVRKGVGLRLLKIHYSFSSS